MCGNKLTLVDGTLRNLDMVARPIENGMWAINPVISNDEREAFTFAQVEEVANLHAAAMDWVENAYRNNILDDENFAKGFFVDVYNNCEIRINVFWDMVSFAKLHFLAKHSFPF